MAFRNILKLTFNQIQQRSVARSISIIPARFSSYRSSEVVTDVNLHPQVEEIQNPPEWKYVEELLGSKTIPKPKVKAEYPSGWCPPDPKRYLQLPYFIERTKNFMLPVYLEITFRGHKRTTLIRRVEGDIWKLEEDLRKLIEGRTQKRCYSRINEMNRSIVFRGDYVTLVQKYLHTLGLLKKYS